MALRSLAIPAFLALLQLGCQRAHKPTPNPVEIDPAEYDRVFAASVDVLRDHGFRVDRQDHRFGQVTTEPHASPTLLEPWINHNTRAGQAAESTLDHLRRTVTVSLEPVTAKEAAALAAIDTSLDNPADAPADGADGASEDTTEAFRLRVVVLLENQQVPIRRLNGSVSGSRFSSLDAVPKEWALRNIDPSYWQPIGRDGYLEDRLARAIIERSLELPE